MLLLSILLLAACGGGSDDGASSSPTDDALSGSASAGQLVVEQDQGDGSAPQRWTLECGSTVSGDHPRAEAACEHLSAIENPFAPLPTDLLCAEVYGGPQTAHITGTWKGQPVDLRVSRRNGCEISQWDSLGPLLPGPVGARQ